MVLFVDFAGSLEVMFGGNAVDGITRIDVVLLSDLWTCFHSPYRPFVVSLAYVPTFLSSAGDSYPSGPSIDLDFYQYPVLTQPVQNASRLDI